MPANQFTPRSRAAWRAWLAKNHAQRSEVWLVFYKQASARVNLSYADGVEEALCYGWIDGVKKRLDEERYTHRFTPRKPTSRWSELNKKRVARLEEAGLMAAAGRKLVKQARQSGKWAEQHPAEKVRVVSPGIPLELERALARNAKARAFFETLAPSYRRRYADWIAIAKREETRARRTKDTIQLLARGKKPGMF